MKHWGRTKRGIDGKIITYDQCVKCGTTEIKHKGDGHCEKCFWSFYAKKRRTEKITHQVKKPMKKGGQEYDLEVKGHQLIPIDVELVILSRKYKVTHHLNNKSYARIIK